MATIPKLSLTEKSQYSWGGATGWGYPKLGGGVKLRLGVECGNELCNYQENKSTYQPKTYVSFF